MTGLGSKNPAVQHLRRLSRRRSARTDSGSFVIDGPVLVAEALDAGLHLDSVYVELGEDGTLPDDVATVAARAFAAGVTRHELAPRVLSGAVDTVTAHGIAAIARTVAVTLMSALSLPARIRSGAGENGGAPGPVLVLAGVGDPGNAGTLLRSAEAAGVRAVIATTGSVDLFAPKTVRASAGSLFRVPVVVGVDAGAVVDGLRAAGVVSIGTASGARRSYEESDLTRPVAIVLGNEAHGLDAVVADAVTELVRIPMEGGVESLNVAMAGTLLVFEAARQRRQAGTVRPDA